MPHIKIFSLLLLGVISGCVSTPQLVPPPIEFTDVILENKAIPQIGEFVTVEIGENMYSEYSIKTKKTYRVKLLDNASGKMDLGVNFSFPKGSDGSLVVTAFEKYKAFCVDNAYYSIATGSAHVCLIDQNGNGVFNKSMFKVRQRYFDLNNPVKYEISANEGKTSIEVPDFKYEVLYQGISKGTIKISFREFKNDMARPAFTQDITYDLNSDGTGNIAFKGLRINVIKATSTNITYQVTKGLK